MMQPRTSHRKSNGSGSMVGAEALTVAGVIFAGYLLVMVVADLLSNYGPSGSYPYSWSYRGNGGLDAFILFPLTLLVAVSLIALWVRGLSYGAGLIAGAAGFVLGAVTVVSTSVGVVGQLPNSADARLDYGIFAAALLAVIGLTVGLGLAHRLVRHAWWALAAGVVTAGAAFVLGIQVPLADDWQGTAAALQQIVVMTLTPIIPLLVGGPARTTGSVHA